MCILYYIDCIRFLTTNRENQLILFSNYIIQYIRIIEKKNYLSFAIKYNLLYCCYTIHIQIFYVLIINSDVQY